jgi:hypothetical protein
LKYPRDRVKGFIENTPARRFEDEDDAEYEDDTLSGRILLAPRF